MAELITIRWTLILDGCRPHADRLIRFRGPSDGIPAALVLIGTGWWSWHRARRRTD